MGRARPFRFSGAAGHALDGRLEEPDGPALGTALFAHCFTCTKNSTAATRIARALGARGWRVLRFDFTGLGESEGEFATAGFASNLDDLAAAANALAAEGMAPALLVGHSLGGAAAIAAAGGIASVRAVATIGAPFHVDHVLARLGEGVRALETAETATIDIGGRPFAISRAFVRQLFDQPQAERLRALDRALLVLHAPLDAMVGIDNARAIFEAAMHPKSFVALDGADHLLTAPGAADYAAGLIAAWAEPYRADGPAR